MRAVVQLERIEMLDTASHARFSDRGTMQLTRIAIEALD